MGSRGRPPARGSRTQTGVRRSPRRRQDPARLAEPDAPAGAGGRRCGDSHGAPRPTAACRRRGWRGFGACFSGAAPSHGTRWGPVPRALPAAPHRPYRRVQPADPAGSTGSPPAAPRRCLGVNGEQSWREGAPRIPPARPRCRRCRARDRSCRAQGSEVGDVGRPRCPRLTPCPGQSPPCQRAGPAEGQPGALQAAVTGVGFFILLLFFFNRLRAEYENHQPKHLKKGSRLVFVLFFPKKCLCVCIGRVFTEDEENPRRLTMYKAGRGGRRRLWYSIDISV